MSCQLYRSANALCLVTFSPGTTSLFGCSVGASFRLLCRCFVALAMTLLLPLCRLLYRLFCRFLLRDAAALVCVFVVFEGNRCA
jgi:hypothetical protein